MPPRTTQQSHRPRVSDRTMVGTSPPRWLAGAPARHEECTAWWTCIPTQVMTRTMLRDSTWNRIPGLDVGELPLPAEREKYFLLTSPFMEPAPVRIVPPLTQRSLSERIASLSNRLLIEEHSTCSWFISFAYYHRIHRSRGNFSLEGEWLITQQRPVPRKCSEFGGTNAPSRAAPRGHGRLLISVA